MVIIPFTWISDLLEDDDDDKKLEEFRIKMEMDHMKNGKKYKLPIFIRLLFSIIMSMLIISVCMTLYGATILMFMGIENIMNSMNY
jgi:hypothetical protein